MPGDWTTADYRNLLDLTEYGDSSGLSEDELKDMAYLSLAEMPKAEAAALLIGYVFPEGDLTPGQIQNSSHEMDTERLWEEYPEPRHHRNFFRVGSLLYAAFNGGHPKPDGRSVTIRIKAKDPDSNELLEQPDPALLLRLLAPGMDGHALLHRLYDDELRGGDFPSAPFLIWSADSKAAGDGEREIHVLSTDYWLEAFEPVGPYSVSVPSEGG